MNKKELKILHNGRCVYGYFYEPDLEEYPVVILSHGYNGDKLSFEATAEYFAENGIGAVCFTFCGGSVRDESGFSSTKMTLFTEEEDLCAVLDNVLLWERVKKDQIFLFGESQGGLVSVMAGSDRKEDVRGMILLYPALCVADDWNDRFRNKEEIPDRMDFWGMELGKEFFYTLRDFDLNSYIDQFKGPVLFMHGAQDEIVPLSYSKSASERYHNGKLEVFAGEKHGFTSRGSRQMEAMAIYFIHDIIGRN